MALILDAGALIGFERGNRTVIAFIEVAQRERVAVLTTTAAVAQVWRSGSLQVRLGRLLRGIDERSLDPSAARRIGELLGSARTADVVDGSIIDMAILGDEVLTTDAADLADLAEAAGKQLTIVPMSA